MPKGKKSDGQYVNGGYLTSTGRLYTSKPGPKSTSNSNNNNSGGGKNIGPGYLTKTGRIYKSKPGPKSSYNPENDNITFDSGYLTSTGRLYKSKPGPKSKNEFSDSKSLTYVLENLSIDSYNQNNNHILEKNQENIRIRPHYNQINNFYNRDLEINGINNNIRNNINNINNINFVDLEKNLNKDEFNNKIKKYMIKIIISDDYIREKKEEKKNNNNNKKEEEEEEEEKNEEYEEKENKNIKKDRKEKNNNKLKIKEKMKDIDESDNFNDSFKSLPIDSIDSTIINLKNDLSINIKKNINKLENNKTVKEEKSENAGDGGKHKINECKICLNHFNKNEKLGILICEHCFHINCIINWFDLGKKLCPICKNKQYN